MLITKEVFRTYHVLPFSCTHLALWRGKVKYPRYIHAKQKGSKNFFNDNIFVFWFLIDIKFDDRVLVKKDENGNTYSYLYGEFKKPKRILEQYRKIEESLTHFEQSSTCKVLKNLLRTCWFNSIFFTSRSLNHLGKEICETCNIWL